MKSFIFSGLVLAALTLGAGAHAQGFVVEANGARSEGVWGAELGAGYEISIAGLAIRPLGGVLVYQGENDRYIEDTFDNGQTRCRDSTNGQFAEDRLCDDTALKAFAKLEASYTIAGSLEIGAGGRYDGGDIRPYGKVSIPLAQQFRVQGNIGEEYIAVGLRARF